MKLSVLIPTYRRPFDLNRCLEGLYEQERKADQILIVVRPEDEESSEVLERWSEQLGLTKLFVTRPGQVHALNVGLDHVTGDVVAITDDDSGPLPDWLARIERHFEADPKLGGLGGRDLIHEDGRILPATQAHVGVIFPFGRFVGNHHQGYGPAREVHSVKGVNMSWRVAAIQDQRFSTELRGAGAQVHNEFAFSLNIASRGWRVVYDPAVQVHHYVAKRTGDSDRVKVSQAYLSDTAYNYYYALLRYMRPGWRQRMALAWAWFIGIANNPGVVRGMVARLKGDSEGVALRAAMVRSWDEAHRVAAEKGLQKA